MSARQWSDDFAKTKGVISQLQGELQRWELLGSQSAGRGSSERAQTGAKIRAKINQLKIDLERLQRELDRLSASSADFDVTRKSITQFKDELAQAFTEVQELQQRSKGAPLSNQGGGSGGRSNSIPSPSGSFVRLAGEPPPSQTAEMAALGSRTLMQRQQDMMKEFDEPLNAIEGSVDNLAHVSIAISQEITVQNRMLDDTNAATSRVNDRLTSTRGLLSQISEADRSRPLWCCVISLFIVLCVVLYLLVF